MLSKVSVVTPSYGCPGALEKLVNQVERAIDQFEGIKYEIIIVNDRCPQNSWDEIIEICRRNSKVKGINFSRNFGQHYAITAGLKAASGDAVIVMDCDLQDPPSLIPDLIKEYKKGFDMVLAKRMERKDGVKNRLMSFLFYKFLGYMTDTKQEQGIANYGIYSKKVVNSVLSMPEQTRLFPVMVRWVGFTSSIVEFEHEERHSGTSSYNFMSKLKLASDIIISFSEKPLWFMVKAGFSMSLISALYAVYIVLAWLFNDTAVQGWTSVIVSIWLLSGFLITFLGVLGIYIGKVYAETKGRPLYIIDKKINFEGEAE